VSKFRAFVYPKGPLKGIREKSIYQDANENKYLRIVTGKRDAFKSLGTKRIGEAIKIRDSRVRAEVAANLGLAKDPTTAAAAAKVTVAVVINRYILDGYPGKKRHASKGGEYFGRGDYTLQNPVGVFQWNRPRAADLDSG